MKLSIEKFDHPLVFLVFLTLALVPIMALMNVGFKKLGWTGPAALVQAA